MDPKVEDELHSVDMFAERNAKRIEDLEAIVDRLERQIAVLLNGMEAMCVRAWRLNGEKCSGEHDQLGDDSDD